jgi:hypothetical protein
MREYPKDEIRITFKIDGVKALSFTLPHPDTGAHRASWYQHNQLYEIITEGLGDENSCDAL